MQDYNKYVEDLISGFYIQHSVDLILHDTDGKRRPNGSPRLS